MAIMENRTTLPIAAIKVAAALAKCCGKNDHVYIGIEHGMCRLSLSDTRGRWLVSAVVSIDDATVNVPTVAFHGTALRGCESLEVADGAIVARLPHNGELRHEAGKTSPNFVGVLRYKSDAGEAREFSLTFDLELAARVAKVLAGIRDAFGGKGKDMPVRWAQADERSPLFGVAEFADAMVDLALMPIVTHR